MDRPSPASPGPGSSPFDEAVRAVESERLGDRMFELCGRLFPVCRSITGDGLRETLDELGRVAELDLHEVPTGYRAFDWTVPREWRVRDAYVKNAAGERVIDFRRSNLHLVNYSAPFRGRLPLSDLRRRLHTEPGDDTAIPYRTTYYNEDWGFCLRGDVLGALPDGAYDVVVDTELFEGSLTYADSVMPGASGREVMLTTYPCHPSMANNELSGPVVSAFLNRMVRGMPGLRYTYRFVYAPETIGALVYLSKHGEHLRSKLAAGYVVTCCGDDGPYTYKRSRRGSSLADRAAEHVLRHAPPGHEAVVHDFFPGGSDERQYCSPGFDLPVGSLMRSMYGTYPEYHTSKDDLRFISAGGLASSLVAYLRLLQVIEMNRRYLNTNPFGEPQLSRRGLYPTLGAGRESADRTRRLAYLLAYSDGRHDLIDIANMCGQPAWEFQREVWDLLNTGLLEPAAQQDELEDERNA